MLVKNPTVVDNGVGSTAAAAAAAAVFPWRPCDAISTSDVDLPRASLSGSLQFVIVRCCPLAL